MKWINDLRKECCRFDGSEVEFANIVNFLLPQVAARLGTGARRFSKLNG
jgi:hypothetical protein